MSPNAQKILDEARQLPHDERDWLAEQLFMSASEESFAAWRKDLGEAEPGYDDWVRAGVEEALADESGDVSHEQAMKHFHDAIQRARRSKASA